VRAFLITVFLSGIATQGTSATLHKSLKFQIRQLEKYTQRFAPDELTQVVVFDSVENKYFLKGYKLETFKGLQGMKSEFLENSLFKVVEFDGEVQENGKHKPLGNKTLHYSDFDGRNVFFHLNAAIRFFRTLDPQNPAISAERKAITVRVRAHLQHHGETHYNVNQKGGNQSGYFAKDPSGRWGDEIWFYKRQSSFKKFKFITSTLIPALFTPWSLILTPLNYQQQHYSGYDTVKLPSVIYHEAFHYATDTEHLLKFSGTPQPVFEDLANYFAISILGAPRIAGLKAFSAKNAKRDFKKIQKVKKQKKKLTSYNYSGFVPQILWQIRTLEGPQKTDQMVWQLAKIINAESWPSDILINLKELTTDFETASEILSVLDKFQCSFYNLNDQFEEFYKQILKLNPPPRPQICSGRKKNVSKEKHDENQ